MHGRARDGEAGFARRSVLTGLAVAGGLAVGYALWPRVAAPNLVAVDGETVFNPWIKVARDGRVTVIVPQLEAGQGSYTVLAQIVADELGADWRTMAIEPAPINSAYDNPVFVDEVRSGLMPETPLQATGFSSTVRAMLGPVRKAAAAARALLCQAAGERWDADWRALDCDGGFVTHGNERLRFGELAEAAGGFDVPGDIPPRQSGERMMGRGASRLDLPAKIDGSANFTADIRLPDMVFASIRQGPPGGARFVSADKAAADHIFGVLQIVEHEQWVAAIATNWWAANRAIDAMRPKFRSEAALTDSASIAKALDAALSGDGTRVATAGNVGDAFAQGHVAKATYRVGLAPHAVLEPLCATAWLDKGLLQIWVATPWQQVARDAAARATGIHADKIVIHTTLGGGNFGRNLDVQVVEQAAILALKIGRPVALMWSRSEDGLQDRFGPPALAKMSARVSKGGRIEAWQTRIAVPDSIAEIKGRALYGKPAATARRDAATDSTRPTMSGAIPPYAIPALAIDHHPADIGIPTGIWRGAADRYTAFFTESFVDELAHRSGLDPLSFRMATLGGNARLAACLAKVAVRGGWEGGGAGTGQGLACHSSRGSLVAVLAEAHIGEDQRVRVSKLVCVADIGRVINPDLARQQIEGGLLFAMGFATGASIGVANGLPAPLRFGALGLPKLADMPEISVELVNSSEVSGGASEVAVPPVAPAIANALFAGSGRRFRSLPLGSAE